MYSFGFPTAASVSLLSDAALSTLDLFISHRCRAFGVYIFDLIFEWLRALLSRDYSSPEHENVLRMFC